MATIGRLSPAVVATVVVLAAAAACGGDAPSASSTAKTPVASVTITPPQQVVAVGATLTLAAQPRDAAGYIFTDRTVEWSSSAPAVATIDAASGVVHAIAPGTTTISATSEGATGTATLQVLGPPARALIDSVVPPLYVGRTAQLTLTVRDAAGQAVTSGQVNWLSSAPSIVTVSSTGLLTGIAPGTTTIFAFVSALGADAVSTSRTITVQAVPSALVSLLPASGFVARGVALPLTLQATDIDGHVVTPKVVTYATSDPTVATVSVTGVVTPVANGAVAITVMADGVPATSRLTVMDARTITGRVTSADGGALSNLQFVARIAATGQRFSTTIDPTSGTYALTLPLFTTTGPPLEFFTDATPGSTRRYHPSWQSLNPGDVPVAPRILLIPHTIVPDSGNYAGRTVSVDLNQAFTPVCTTASDANCQSYWPSYWIGGIKMWPDAARPVPLAIDRTPSSVGAADSVGLWGTIHNMEADLGRKLFAPANFTAYSSSGYTAGMVLASVDPTVAPFSGYTNWLWDSQGFITQAKVRFAAQKYFDGGGITSHELNHALGLHHTCMWATIMGSYGCPIEARMTAEDVAYWHLAQLVRRQVVAVNASWSIAEALQGVRVVELGMAPANALALRLQAMRSLLALPGGDGAP